MWVLCVAWLLVQHRRLTWAKFAWLFAQSLRHLELDGRATDRRTSGDAMRPASADMLLRLLSGVVNLLPTVSFLRRYDDTCVVRLSWPLANPMTPYAHSHWRVFRRLTSKVRVDLITDRARTRIEPLQSHVKTPNDCEATVHVARCKSFRIEPCTPEVILHPVVSVVSVPDCTLNVTCALTVTCCTSLVV